MPLEERKFKRNNILNDFKQMKEEEKEQFLAQLWDDLHNNHKNGIFHNGCEDKLVDVDVRKDAKPIKKLVQMKTKAREFKEDVQLSELHKINSLLH